MAGIRLKMGLFYFNFNWHKRVLLICKFKKIWLDTVVHDEFSHTFPEFCHFTESYLCNNPILEIYNLYHIAQE